MQPPFLRPQTTTPLPVRQLLLLWWRSPLTRTFSVATSRASQTAGIFARTFQGSRLRPSAELLTACPPSQAQTSSQSPGWARTLGGRPSSPLARRADPTGGRAEAGREARVQSSGPQQDTLPRGVGGSPCQGRSDHRSYGRPYVITKRVSTPWVSCPKDPGKRMEPVKGEFRVKTNSLSCFVLNLKGVANGERDPHLRAAHCSNQIHDC